MNVRRGFAAFRAGFIGAALSIAAGANAITVDVATLGTSQTIPESFGDSPGADLLWDPLGNNPLIAWTPPVYSGGSAAYCGTGNSICNLDIVPTGPNPIKLQSFSLGSYFNAERGIAWSIFDLDDLNTPLLSGNPTVSTGLTVTANLLSNNGFRVQFGPDGYYGGINNISYTVVPLPAAAWLFISGLAALIGIGRRRRTLAKR